MRVAIARLALLTGLAAGCGGDGGTPPSPPPPPATVPTTLEQVFGDAQNGVPGKSVPDSLVIRVRDQLGNAMGNVAVTWTVVAGGGAASGAGPTTSTGLAAIAWTLGPSPGDNAIEARIPSLTPARFTATGVSPGSGTIAFEARNGVDASLTDIFLMGADGGNIRGIVEHEADDGEPAWSPDGSKIAFKTSRNGRYDIYVVNTDGTGLTRLTTDPSNDIQPRWSPDGTKIAFQRESNGNGKIWVMNADGSGATQVTPLGTGRDSKPSWSPDGTRIVFATERYDFGGWEIAVINADGSGLTRLTNRLGYDYGPVWARDGTIIAFSTDRWGSVEAEDIATMRPDGTDVRQVTKHPDVEQLPFWSPDGAKLVYTCWRRRGGALYSELCSINADGTGELRLTPRTPWASHAAWFR